MTLDPRLQKKSGINKFILTQVNIWNADQILLQKDIVVENGMIQSIRPPSSLIPQGFEVIPGQGLTVLPAGVDAQVHLRVPGQSIKETPWSGLQAAVKGGFAAVLNMPNTNPIIDSVEALQIGQQEIAEAEKELGVKVLWSAALTRGQNSEELTDVAALIAAGVSAITDDGKGIAKDELMLKGFQILEKYDIPFLQHAEVPGHGGVLAPSDFQVQNSIPPYYEAAEVDMVRRDLDLLKKAPKARYHLLHVSSAQSLELIKAAKKENLKVSVEVSPHHLVYTVEDIVNDNISFKMNPPVRTRKDRAAFVHALENGDIDFVATDHAPHEPEKKKSFLDAAFGTTGLETCLPVLIDLYQQKKLSPQRLVQVFSTQPAEFLGLQKTYGCLREGLPFYALLIDPEAASTRVSAKDFLGLSKNCCFIDDELPMKTLKQVFFKDTVYTVGI